MEISILQQQFQDQYNELFDKLYRYIFTRITSKTDCEDIVSEVFFQAYKNLETYKTDKGNFEQWLIGIARYKIIDYWKSQVITFELDDASQVFNLVIQENDVNERIDQKELFTKIMRKLPPQIEALCILRYIDNLTYEEIAEFTGKQPATIRKIFSRLHAKLRLQFQEYYV